MKTNLKYLKIFSIIGLSLLVTSVIFRSTDSPTVLVGQINNLIYSNRITNAVFADNGLYKKMVESVLTSNVNASEERTVEYKGRRLKIYSADSKIPKELLEYVYQQEVNGGK